jgi:hypothetical protein
MSAARSPSMAKVVETNTSDGEWRRAARPQAPSYRGGVRKAVSCTAPAIFNQIRPTTARPQSATARHPG